MAAVSINEKEQCTTILKKYGMNEEAWHNVLFEGLANLAVDTTTLFKELEEDIECITEGKMVNPCDAETVFASTQNIKPKDVRVIIIGQDPPKPGGEDFKRSLGYAFGTDDGATLSLRNIFFDLTNEGFIDNETTPDGTLVGWIQQGCLLINAIPICGSVRPALKNNLELMTKALLQGIFVTQSERAIVYIPMGKESEKAMPVNRNGAIPEFECLPKHVKISTCHPIVKGYPYSGATTGENKFKEEFLNKQPFKKANAHFLLHNEQEVKWENWKT